MQTKQNKFGSFYTPGADLPAEKIALILAEYAAKKSIYQAAQAAHVSYNTANKYISGQTAKVHGKPIHCTYKTNPFVLAYIEGMLIKYPTMFLHELAYNLYHSIGIALSIPYLSKLKRHTLRILHHKISLVARQRASLHVQQARQKWKRIIQQLPIQQLVFIDESHFETRHVARRYAHVPAGEDDPLIYQHSVSRQSWSLIAAMTYQGDIHYQILNTAQHGVSGMDFGQFLQGLFPLLADNAILIMDNAQIHKTTEVQDILNLSGLVHFFQSPYSPDFNPIELLFGSLKGFLRDLVFQEGPLVMDHAIEYCIDQITVQHIQSFIQHCSNIWHDMSKE